MKTTTTIQLITSGVIAWIAAKLGILFPVLMTLMALMVIDYITGMMASKVEAVEHPSDPAYGWSSKKGAVGIAKKVGYLCMIAVAMVLDYTVLNVATTLGVTIPNIKAFFGLMTAAWYILNEALSITENAGRIGAPVPAWLTKYIAVLKDKIDDKAEDVSGNDKE